MKEKLNAILERNPYFLILLPCFFILHGYNLFFGFFPLLIIVINLGGAVLLSWLIHNFLYFLLSRKDKRSALTFFVLLVVFFFRSLHDFLKKSEHGSFLGKYSIILPIFIIAIFLLYLYLKKIVQTKKLILFLNTLTITLLLLECVVSMYNLVNFNKKDSLLKIQGDSYEIKANITIPDSLKPDIYFIVFDGMPNAQALNEINSSYIPQFYSFLEEKNFKIQYKSLSNYNQTVFSISSTLNMQYIDPQSAVYDHLHYLKALESLKSNKLLDFLKRQNYRIFQIQPLSFNNKDWQGTSMFSNLLSEHFFYETLPGCIYKDMRFHLNRFDFFKNRNKKDQVKKIKQKKSDILLTLSKTRETLSYSKTPKFVYAHFMIPHEPYIYNSKGELLLGSEKIISKENELTKFYEQALYAEKTALDLVDYLMKKNKKNTIIVIEGDHGFRSLFVNSNHLIYKNLNAIYIPNQTYSSIYSSMSPVNTFRFVLNNYFDTRLPILKDSSIFIPYSLNVEK